MAALSANVSARGSIRLPRQVRQALNVKPGTKVTFEITPAGVVLRRQPRLTADRLAGSLRKYARKPVSIEEETELTKYEVARAAAQEGR